MDLPKSIQLVLCSRDTMVSKTDEVSAVIELKIQNAGMMHVKALVQHSAFSRYI